MKLLYCIVYAKGSAITENNIPHSFLSFTVYVSSGEFADIYKKRIRTQNASLEHICQRCKIRNSFAPHADARGNRSCSHLIFLHNLT